MAQYKIENCEVWGNLGIQIILILERHYWSYICEFLPQNIKMKKSEKSKLWTIVPQLEITDSYKKECDFLE